MALKVGDKILVRREIWRGNGHGEAGERIYPGEVTDVNPQGIRVRLPDGKEVDIPWTKTEFLVVVPESQEFESVGTHSETLQKSLLQKALEVGKEIVLFPIEAILTIIGLVGWTVFLAGAWLWKKTTSLRKRKSWKAGK